MLGIAHGREAETQEAKARWFRSLSPEERMEYLCTITDLVLENNRRVFDLKNAQAAARGVRILGLP